MKTDAVQAIVEPIERRGIMFVLSSPSGAGKSTIARHMLEQFSDLELSVSVTTRKRRGSEIDARHYNFVSVPEFERLRDGDALLEWAQVHGNFYGSPQEPVAKALSGGRDVLFDIDWQGGTQLTERARADVVSVFVLPPSMSELQRRLKRRAEDSEEIIADRLNNAVNEIPHWREYDYVVVNDDLDKAFHQVESIMIAERLRRDRRPGLFEFEKRLLG